MIETSAGGSGPKLPPLSGTGITAAACISPTLDIEMDPQHVHGGFFDSRILSGLHRVYLDPHKETILLFSDVYDGVNELHQKTVTEILVHYGLPTFPGEYEQIVQLVEAAEAVESWETDKADKRGREAVALATEIKLRRKEVADSATT